MPLHLLAAGASKGLVGALRDRFAAETGQTLEPIFNAVGAIKERFLAGDPCDVIILSARLLDELAAHGHLIDSTISPIGIVRTGVAVPAGQTVPDIATGPALATALRAAGALYIPDPDRSTAGIHVMSVLRALGIDAELRTRIRPFPNGATAMHALATAPEPGAIGMTQVTEIKYSPGLTLVGALPEPHGLSTIYSAAVVRRAADPDAARALVTLLTGPASADIRAEGGFEPAAPR